MIELLEQYAENRLNSYDSLKKKALRTLHYNIDVERTDSTNTEKKSHEKLYDDLTNSNYHNESDFENDSMLSDYEFIIYFVEKYPNVNSNDINRITNIAEQYHINYQEHLPLLYFIIKNAYTLILLIAFASAKYVIENCDSLHSKIKHKDINAESEIVDNLFNVFGNNEDAQKYGKVVKYIIINIDSVDIEKYLNHIKNEKIRGDCAIVFKHNTTHNILDFCSFIQGFDDERQLLKTFIYNYLDKYKEKNES